MTLPKPIVRRCGLVAWLAGYGFTEGQVDQLIRDGIIPQKHFDTENHKRLRRKPRAYYITSNVAAALHLSAVQNPS